MKLVLVTYMYNNKRSLSSLNCNYMYVGCSNVFKPTRQEVMIGGDQSPINIIKYMYIIQQVFLKNIQC